MKVKLSDILNHIDVISVENINNTDLSFKSFQINSKEVCKDTLFFALKGKQHDGHDFLNEAMKKGATAAVVERMVKNVPIPQIIVRSTVETLGKLAHEKIKEYGKNMRICITGSNGKTTTKELIYHYLSKKKRSFRNKGNLNTEIGLPLSILNDYKGEDILILEFGINKPGDMDKLIKIVNPTVALLLNIGSAHIGNFGSIEGLFYEKAKLIFSLDSNSLAILNEDDPRIANLKNIKCNIKFSGFGKKRGKVKLIGWTYNAKHNIHITNALFMIGKKKVEFTLKGIWNTGQLLDLAAAISLIESLGYDTDPKVFSDFEIPDGRFKLKKGNGVFIIDDTYNSNIESVKVALDTILDLHVKKKIAVIGSMKELGKFSKHNHMKLGSMLNMFDMIFLYTKDPDILMIKEGINGSKTHEENDPIRLSREILSVIEKDDLVYFKASRTVEIERVMQEVWKNLNNSQCW